MRCSLTLDNPNKATVDTKLRRGAAPPPESHFDHTRPIFVARASPLCEN